jgi:hypothetical protein
MAEVDVAELERQVRAGVWLGPTAVGKLLGLSRWTIAAWMDAKPPTIRSTRYGLRNRRCDPLDVVRILDERRAGGSQTPLT